MTELINEIHTSALGLAQYYGVQMWPATTKALTNHCVELLYDASTDKKRWVYLTIGPHINLSYNTPYHGLQYQPPYDLNEKQKVAEAIVTVMSQAKV